MHYTVLDSFRRENIVVSVLAASWRRWPIDNKYNAIKLPGDPHDPAGRLRQGERYLMIKISLVVFLLVLQALLVSVLLAGFALLKVRKLSARLAARRASPVQPPAPVAGAPNDAAHYLATELQRTRGRLEGLGGATASAGASASATGRLALRAELLQMEAEWAGLTEYDDAAWNKLDARLHMLLAQDAAAPVSPAPPATQSAGKDEVEAKRLLDEQHATIEQLKAAIASAVSDPDTTESLQAQLEKLGRTARELTFCVAILEDENQLLRDQVRALVQTE